MSSQKIGSIKVPPFKRENYSMWKDENDIVHESI